MPVKVYEDPQRRKARLDEDQRQEHGELEASSRDETIALPAQHSFPA